MFVLGSRVEAICFLQECYWKRFFVGETPTKGGGGHGQCFCLGVLNGTKCFASGMSLEAILVGEEHQGPVGRYNFK